jgi:hypothetical protein
MANYWGFIQHNVLVVRGEEAQKAYFDDKGSALNLLKVI